MNGFYAGQTPFLCERLDPDDGYNLYFEESGSQDGVAVLYLHGGAGTEVEPTPRRAGREPHADETPGPA